MQTQLGGNICVCRTPGTSCQAWVLSGWSLEASRMARGCTGCLRGQPYSLHAPKATPINLQHKTRVAKQRWLQNKWPGLTFDPVATGPSYREIACCVYFTEEATGSERQSRLVWPELASGKVKIHSREFCKPRSHFTAQDN